MILPVHIPLAKESDPEEGTDCSADELHDQCSEDRSVHGMFRGPCFSPVAATPGCSKRPQRRNRSLDGVALPLHVTVSRPFVLFRHRSTPKMRVFI
jgi:hypothetical protein